MSQSKTPERLSDVVYTILFEQIQCLQRINKKLADPQYAPTEDVCSTIRKNSMTMLQIAYHCNHSEIILVETSSE